MSQAQVSDGKNKLMSARGGEDAKNIVRQATSGLSDYKKQNDFMTHTSSDLEEAAMFYSSGDLKSTIDSLIKHLNETKGQAGQRAWFMLLDAYQVSAQRAQFDKLSLYFANRFNTSPPSWFDYEEDKMEKMSGRNALVIDGSPSILKSEKVKDLLSAAKETGQCRIDLSRMRLEKDDDNIFEGLEKVLEMLVLIRTRKYLVTLMGADPLIAKLEAWIDESKKVISGRDQPVWLLLFELLQWRNEEARFDDLALEYATLYEMSPPGYDNSKVNFDTGDQNAEPQEKEAILDKENHIIQPPENITQENVDVLIQMVSSALKEHEIIIIDFKKVKLIDFYAAGTLSAFLNSSEKKKEQILLQEPIELIVMLLETTGALECVTLIPRKR